MNQSAVVSVFPLDSHLVDLFHVAAPGIVITKADGTVVRTNPAAHLLLDSSAGPVDNLITAFDLSDHDSLRANEPARYLPVSFANSRFPKGFATVGYGQVAGETYAFWALRPITSNPTPHPDFINTDPQTSGQAWADAVVTAAKASTPAADEQTIALIKGFYDFCPVGIHLIEPGGAVTYANAEDIAIVGATAAPSEYIGRHIRHSYADQDVVDDFVSRWDNNDPIIDFRAYFLNNTEKVPVVIFSTARIENGALHNTRCFVFTDNDPDQARDRVTELDLGTS